MTEPNIDIGILSGRQINFELYGDFTLTESEKRYSGRYSAKLEGGKISILQENKEVYSSNEIVFSPNDIETESFLLRDVTIGKQFHWEKKENQRFRGRLKLIKEKNNVTGINIIPIEEYLISVISSEMSPNSSLELLKAHAIVSRGWLLAQLDKKKQSKKKKSVNEILTDSEITRWYDREDHSHFDLCADDHCQRYQGVTKIINDNALNAIEATRGLVLVYDNKICDTRYSKCCGGMTESFENVWEPVKHHYLSPVVDYKFEIDGIDYDLTNNMLAEKWIKNNPHAYCNTNDPRILSQIMVDFDRPTNNFFRWTVEYIQEDLAEIIRSKSGIDFGNIIDLTPLQRGYSGRITRLQISGDKKELIIGKELEIRRVLSKSHLYSSAFYVTRHDLNGKVPGKFVLHGAGWGHGVGLCQIGAAVMGEKGYGFDEILIHYFNGAKIQKIYS
ncbi:MAG TPA: SpoIID/LytB domain-containing protein [Melioribacteraceae bacterium]|nr:SpoIID/LytB domain-containing protein [Melioribacteraceae bacterium]